MKTIFLTYSTKIKTFFSLVFFTVLTNQASATDLAANEDGFFASIGVFMQDFVNFLEGPWGLFVPIAGLSIAVAVWMFSTRGGEQMGWIGRVVFGSLLLVNVPSFVVAMQAYAA